MARLAKTEGYRDIIAQQKSIRADVRQRLNALHDDNFHSDGWKIAQREAIKDEARDKLYELGDKASEVTPDFAALMDAASRFDYSDAKLTTAVQLIQTMGSKLPESAWAAMIKDFANRPAMLNFLADTFDENRVPDAAIAAKEEAKAGAYLTSLPQRIEDEVFYSSRREPDVEVDFSGVLAALDKLDELGDKLTSGAVEEEATA